MAIKTALAPTIELGTPRVRAFAEKLLPHFGPDAQIHRFYECEPGTSDVFNTAGERWVEGNWGLEIIGHSFDSESMRTMDSISDVIEISGFTISSFKDHRILANLWLSARVMRH